MIFLENKFFYFPMFGGNSNKKVIHSSFKIEKNENKLIEYFTRKKSRGRRKIFGDWVSTEYCHFIKNMFQE